MTPPRSRGVISCNVLKNKRVHCSKKGESYTFASVIHDAIGEDFRIGIVQKVLGNLLGNKVCQYLLPLQPEMKAVPHG